MAKRMAEWEWLETDVQSFQDKSVAWLSQHHFFRDPSPEVFRNDIETSWSLYNPQTPSGCTVPFPTEKKACTLTAAMYGASRPTHSHSILQVGQDKFYLGFGGGPKGLFMAKKLLEWLEAEVNPFRDKPVAWLLQHPFFRDLNRPTYSDLSYPSHGAII